MKSKNLYNFDNSIKFYDNENNQNFMKIENLIKFYEKIIKPIGIEFYIIIKILTNEHKNRFYDIIKFLMNKHKNILKLNFMIIRVFNDS